MPRQPKVHFRLKQEDKKLKSKLPLKKQAALNEKCLVYLEFVYKGNRLFYSFGQFVNPIDWDPQAERVKNKQSTADGLFKLNDTLNELQRICETGIIGVTPTPETLRAAMDAFINQNHNEVQPGNNRPTLYKLINSFVNGEIKIGVGKRRGRDKGESCLKNYYTTQQRLKDFETAESYSIDFDTITMEFFNKYVTYLDKVKKLKPNTIAKDIATIKVFMNEAVDREWTDNLHFKKKGFSYSEEETDHTYFTEADLHKLYKFDFSDNKKLDQVRDLFIFGAWVGLRFSDYSTVKPENIKQIDGDYFIDMITQKTKERVIIPCNPVILEIFKKYDNNANKLPYGNNPISNQKFNQYIKDACREAEMNEKGRLSSKPGVMLWQTVSSHTCRRSMITNYYLQGFPTIDLMKISGHRTESNFMKYLKLSPQDTAKRMAAHNKKNWSAMMLRVA